MLRVCAVASLAPLAVALASCKEDATKAKAAPPLVQTVVVGASDRLKQRFTGTVRARTESTLSFRIGGKVVERLVDAGARVRKGQPLMRVDRTDLSLTLTSARAAVEAARADSARASAEQARQRKNALAGTIRDRIRADARATAARLTAAQAQASLIANQVRYAELQADADGTVMEVSGEPGQVVAAGQPVMTLARDGEREAEIFLPEGKERQAGGDALAHLYAQQDQSYPARLREVAAAADPATRTYRARYALEGAEQASLGSTVTVELERALRGETPTISVPLGALLDNGNGIKVWKVDPTTSRISAQPVTIARLGTDAVEVSAGLERGERIVALGAHLLKQDQQVRIAPEQTASITR